MVKINSQKPEASLVRYAADQIRAGEVLGMPTDTFYGLAADPFNLRAVDKVYDIKTRDRKSTRLNSSHSQISYAVFCLKKKNKSHSCIVHLKILDDSS